MGRSMRTETRAAYEQAMRTNGGALPTVRDVAAICGATASVMRRRLQAMGLPYARMTPQEAGALSAHNRRMEAVDRFRAAYDALEQEQGRPPTATEMSLKMDLAPGSGNIGRMARRLGLELTRRRRQSTGQRCSEPLPRVIAPVSEEFRFGHGVSPRMDRVMEIRGSTACAPGEGWEHRPGEAYAADDRIMITCPVCGVRKLIAPRMHPHWIRNQAGAVIFVCRAACTGQVG